MSNLNDDIDLVFLTEIRDRLTRARTDVSELEMVETMVDDWIHQLNTRAAQPAEDTTAALAGEVFEIVRAVEQQQTAARKPWGWALIQSPLTATVCIGAQCPSNLSGLPNVRAVYLNQQAYNACDATGTVPQAPRAFRTPEPGTPWWQTAKDCGAWTDRNEGDLGYVHFGSVEALWVYTRKIQMQVQAAHAAVATLDTSTQPATAGVNDHGPHTCVRPHCPNDCSMCNHAIAADDEPRQIILKLLQEFAKDGHGGEFEDGEHPLVDQARKFLHRARSASGEVR